MRQTRIEYIKTYRKFRAICFHCTFFRMTLIPPQLADEVAKILSTSYSPSGDEGVAEIATDHLVAEQFVERVYGTCVESLGQMHAITMEIFFKLFDIWIGLYRLEKCEDELARFGEDDTNIRLIQSWAFLRWKQGDQREALRLFKQMESTTQSPALFENLAHTYSSLGDLDMAEQYFVKAASEMADGNKGGVLLGLGLLKNRRNGGTDGVEICMDALEWYAAKFSKKGNMSSLEAKCAMSIAKIWFDNANEERAIQFANSAVENFRITCGNDSPLLASALKVKGDILWMLSGDREGARDAFREAFNIEAEKDALSLVDLIQLNNAIIDTFTKPNPQDGCSPGRIDRDAFKPLIKDALHACDSAKSKLPHDANLGAFFKIVAELAIWANDLRVAKSLLEDALPLLKCDGSSECLTLRNQSTELIKLIDRQLN